MRSIILAAILFSGFASADTMLVEMPPGMVIASGEIIRYCDGDPELCPDHGDITLAHATIEHFESDTIMAGGFDDKPWHILVQPISGSWAVIERVCSAERHGGDVTFFC
jgi:hypothetical protein